MCISIERLLDKGKTHDAAMKARAFSCNRSKKIWDNVLQKFGVPPLIYAEQKIAISYIIICDDRSRGRTIGNNQEY